MTGDDLVRVLERLVSIYASPTFLRTDNGTEMTCNSVEDWCRFGPTGIIFIDPGSPWQNPFIESFNGKHRDEILAVEQFHTLAEAKIIVESYRQDYGQLLPHSSLGYLTPNELMLDWHTNNRISQKRANQPGGKSPFTR